MCTRSSDAVLRDSYYVMLKDGSTWLIKGCCHSHTWYSAIPVRPRIRNPADVPLVEGRTIIPPFTPFPITIVWRHEIMKVLDPLKWRAPSTWIGSRALELLENLRSVLEYSSVGITGSLLLKGVGNDVDIVIYADECRDVDPQHIAELLTKILKPLENTFLKEEVPKADGLPHNFRVLNLASNPLFGVYAGVPVSIRIVDCRMSEAVCDKKYTWNRKLLRVEVEESLSPYTTPAIYRLRDIYGVRYFAYTNRLSLTNLGPGTLIRGIMIVEHSVRYGHVINLDRSTSLYVEKFKPFSENLG
ncbi:MAG: hypothetical protein DRO12_01595 [Thermoprotei archaeon]|nr:MAG: hypothetical protein DRO12_01595 [Thermoprotei archaeon]